MRKGGVKTYDGVFFGNSDGELNIFPPLQMEYLGTKGNVAKQV